MTRQFPQLMKDALRQGIAEAFNRHVPDAGAPNIALIGSRRSGSTLIMQLLAHHPGMKSVDQPFSVYTATRAQLRHLPFPAGGIFVKPADQELNRLTNYVQGIRSGSLHVREPWRFWRPDFWFRSNRLVLKTTDAHFLIDHLTAWGFRPVLYFRHPIPQSLSCQRNNWGDNLDRFAAHHMIRTEILTPAQNALLDQVRKDGTSLERYVLGWCLENLPLFKALGDDIPSIFYEDLVLMPDVVIERLASVCDVDVTVKMTMMLKQVSFSGKGLSESSTEKAINSGDREMLVGRWREKLSATMLADIERLLTAFPGCPYTAYDVSPKAEFSSAV